MDRKAILGVLNKRQVTNEIFTDFKDHLTDIENATNSYVKSENIISDWQAGEGFYIKLQEQINEPSDWRYVQNEMGGFLCFSYHWAGTNEITKIYIQIENAIKYKSIKLVIKIGGSKLSTPTLYRLLKEIKPYAEKNGLTTSKPKRYKAGETSTLAVIQAFNVNNIEDLELDKFIETLKRLEVTLNEYCEDKNKQQET